MDLDLHVRGVIETLRLKPGDRLLVTVDRLLTMEQRQEMYEQIQKWCGGEWPVLVAGPGVEFQVAGRDEESAGG